ncbi:motilin-like isoform X2 [Xyrichtys novacula]|uniref:Motilin-like isoform X2 n=1 Tax=Xyrichtys novacula TaxID=13765 RepID=A0AAV1ERY7_XYRNO|nr:motilin-like isoform X2 [Xyrichtys novacula]
MSMRGAVAGCMVLACLVALLAERTEGHITFFSPKELMEMKEREDRKDMAPRSEDSQPGDVTTPDNPPVENGGDPNTPEVSGMLVSSDQVITVLGGIIHELAKDHPKAK